MTKLSRVEHILTGLLILVVAILMLLHPASSYILVMVFLGFGFLVRGIKNLHFYITMARFMVGGKSILVRGVIMTDFAILTLSLTDVPKLYVLIYLAAVHLFSGVIDILRATEIRSNQSKGFKMKLTHGLVNVIIAISCFVYMGNPDTVVIIYAIGLIYTAIDRIITAFRRTAFVYIQ